ncbi:YLP motif-containing protein 1 [Portunus trituberculatus]|uniref:YLP motif-containing protein 1 n=1 Tax=Portunus trituberculatus TaxID=210409 RepID=A0A5B7D542_PORTR|nr:YLP motif-containing protein 1 [Portunus trituberculatus]
MSCLLLFSHHQAKHLRPETGHPTHRDLTTHTGRSVLVVAVVMYDSPDRAGDHHHPHHLRGGREDNRGSPWANQQLPPRDPMGRDRDRSPPRASPAPRQDQAPRAPTPPTLPSPPEEKEEEEEEEEEGETVTIDDLVSIPGRFMRPPKIAIILRGPPGAGKTTVARMIKVRGVAGSLRGLRADREVENGGSPPRILCLDDYFMVETEKMTNDPETGRRVKTKIMEYEYEPELEESYRASLIKSFKRHVSEGFFPFIVVDCVNDRISHFSEIASYAKKHGFEVYIGELEVDQSVCLRSNTHNHPKEHIARIINGWERTPQSLTRVDLTPLAQDAAIEEMPQETGLCCEAAFVALAGLEWWHCKHGQDCASAGHSFGPVECVSSHSCCLLCCDSS